MRSSVLTPEFCGYLHLRFIRHLRGFGPLRPGNPANGGNYHDRNEGKRTKQAGLLRDGASHSLDRLSIALSGLPTQHAVKERLQEIEAELLFGLFTSPHMKGQLNAVAQTLLIKNATNVTLYRPQAEL